MPQLAGKLILAGLIPLGAWVLHGFASCNGLIQMFEAFGKQTVLSDGVTEYTGAFTGLEDLDRLLRTLLNFFWPVANGHDWALSLHAFMFAGQGVPLLVLNMLEGARPGNKSLVVSYVTVFGILYMVVGLAIMAPLYLFLHFLTSRTATAPSKANVAVDPNAAKAVGFGVFVGYILPTIFMSFPHPSLLSTDTKVLSVVFWQGVPLWASVCAYVASTALGQSATSQSPSNLPSALRAVYASSIVIATATHVATFAMSAHLSDTWSGIFAFVIPPNPFNMGVRISSFLEGATWFLQWDYTMMSLAYMVWAIGIRYGVEVPRSSHQFETLGEITLRSMAKLLVMGPIGAALSLVWERDQVVWQLDSGSGGKAEKSRSRRMSRKWMFS